MLTEELIFKLSPKANPTIVRSFVDTVNKNSVKYGLVTADRVSKYLANVMVETDGLKTFQEYASGAAYEGRKDLGNIYPGDGKKFKGRGALQTTGRANYEAVSMVVYGNKSTLTQKPEILADPVQGTIASLIFWNSKNLNFHADNSPFSRVVKIINGGLTHLKQRTEWLSKITDELKKKIKRNPKTNSDWLAYINRFLYSS